MKVAYINHTYPQLTQTFVYREIQALRRLGLEVLPVSIKRPAQSFESGKLENEIAKTTYLPATRSPAFWIGFLKTLFRHPIRSKKNLLIYFSRDGNPHSRRSLTRFLLDFVRGLVLAEFFRSNPDITHAHSPFSTEAATSLLIASQISKIRFSFRNHTCFDAIFIPEKLRRSAFALSISEFDKKLMLSYTDGKYSERIEIVHCGIDPDQWPIQKPVAPSPKILSVGSLIPKKGHDVLINACRLLVERGIDFQCDIIGGGPLMGKLSAQVKTNGLQERVFLHGPIPQEKVRRFYREARIFALACNKSPEGDLDGIPVALMEAMALGKAVISTWLSGIPELIRHSVNGLLAQPGDPKDLADQLEQALTDTDLIEKLHHEAPLTIRKHFNLSQEAAKLKTILERRG